MAFRGYPTEVKYITEEDLQKQIENLKKELIQTNVKTYYVQSKDKFDDFLKFGLSFALALFIFFLVLYTLYRKEK